MADRKRESLTQERLVAHLHERGYADVTVRRIADWRRKNLLPPFDRAGSGRGRSRGRECNSWSEGELVIDQAQWICELLQMDRNFESLYLPLWMLGYPIPLTCVRRALSEPLNAVSYSVEVEAGSNGEVSADAGYISGENMYAVLLAGAIPYIAFRNNCALDANYKSNFWKDMLYLYKTRHPRFLDHYYRRNNVEATFSSMKAKFGGRLRSKSMIGQFNEALCKALCHNICVLIHSMHKLGIDPTSWGTVQVRPEAMAGLTGAGLEHRQKDFVEIKIAAAGREGHVEEKAGERVRPFRTAVQKLKRRHTNPGQASLFESRL